MTKLALIVVVSRRKNKQSDINWPFLVLSAWILWKGVLSSTPIVKKESHFVDVTLSHDIVNIKGSKGSIDMVLWTEGYNNRFLILRGGISRGKYSEVTNLKMNQKLQFQISSKGLDVLGKGKDDIVVRGIHHDGRSIYTDEEFTNGMDRLRVRLKFLACIVFILLFLNGFKLISLKVNYTVVGLFIFTLIIMKIFQFGLY